MKAKAKPVPEGYHSITPYLCVKGAPEALEFYKKAFGAEEACRMPGPGGKIAHAEIAIGDSKLMLADEFPEMDFRSPQSIGGTPVTIHFYVEACDAVFNKAVAAGAQVVRPLQDQFYGDRSGTVKDPFGHVWHISTHQEDLTPEEITERMKTAGK